MAVQNPAHRGWRRAELRDFLRSRRARVSPADVGMPCAGRRRTPGLRREEVAVIAGVGVSWYTWLEQGRDINVSDSVLDAISRALLLDADERVYLYWLAGLTPPPPVIGSTPMPPALRRLLDGWLPRPAYILDDHWRCGGDNRAACAIFQSDHQRPFLTAFFERERYRCDTWAETAATLTARLRTHIARAPGDLALQCLVDDLSADRDFARLWGRHHVHDDGGGLKKIIHPDAGELIFDSSLTLEMPARPGHQIIVLDPDPTTLAKIIELMPGPQHTGHFLQDEQAQELATAS